MGKTKQPDTEKPNKFKKSLDPDRAVVKKPKIPKHTATDATKNPSACSEVGRTDASDQTNIVKRSSQSLNGYENVDRPDQKSTPRIHSLQAAASQLEQMMASPNTVVGLTALQLTSDQKTIVKRGCQSLFGYKHVDPKSTQRIHNLQAATSQLEQMMALAKQRKAAATKSKP